MVFNEAKGKCYLCMLNVIPVLFTSSVDIRFYHSLQCCIFTLYLLFFCFVLCSLTTLSSLYRLYDVEWKADHEGKVLEEITATYYEVSPSNLNSVGEITDRSIALRIPDTRNRASNQTDNPWIKGEAVPLQAWSGPEGSRKLRFPDIMTKSQDGGKVVSLTHRPPLPPGNTPGTHFC